MRNQFAQFKLLRLLVLLTAYLITLIGCSNSTALHIDTPVTTLEPILTATKPSGIGQLTSDQIATLKSLEKVDDHPLYTMRYFGTYKPASAAIPVQETFTEWSCSLFATLTDEENLKYGRNFDWQYSPAVLLFASPPDGYASVSLVDIAYLGYDGDRAKNLLDLPVMERQDLLAAPYLPFDGMNEYGLVIGMAAVSPGNMRPDPNKATVGSLEIIRQLLDHARTVDEAIAMFNEFNIDFGGGPPIHYLLADRLGNAALVEFYQGELVVSYKHKSWHQDTNFLHTAVSGTPEGQCWRYDLIAQRLDELSGQLSAQSAMDLLSSVAQSNTQWSVVYDFGAGDILIAMRKAYGNIHTFRLEMAPR